MSIAGSLANALSGLSAQSRAAQVVSSNVANATTDGYAKRELVLNTLDVNGGVQVTGVRRDVDLVTLGNRRVADAAVGYDTEIQSFYSQLEQVLGTPDESGSLSGRMDSFETALIEAAARPDSDARLAAVLSAATDITEGLNTASDKVQDLRMAADREIAAQVEMLNSGLTQVQELNYKIKQAVVIGNDASALMDLRQQTIDAMSEIVPMKQVEREHGMVALFTTGGAILLDGRPAEVGFETTGTIVAEMTLEGGALSGLTINGKDVATTGNSGLVAGGSLSALFEVRDELAITAQSRLDALSRDLVERFQDASVDATRAVGDPGLFTDAGAAFDTADELGLAGRISVNALVDPDAGGALWRIRDGLGATAAGDVGDTTLLQELSDAFTAGRVPASGDFVGAARSASGLAADVLSLTYAELTDVENSLAYNTAEAGALKEQELALGVDTDEELQNLMLIEQAFAANAKVIQTVEAMLDAIMEF